MSKNGHNFARIENLLGDHHECFPAAGVLGGNIASKLESSLFMRELCCIEIKVKAGDSEEFDHGALIVGNIDNANPPVNKICIGNCYYFKIVMESALCLL